KQIYQFLSAFFLISLLINHQSLYFVLFTSLFFILLHKNQQFFEDLKTYKNQSSTLMALAICLYFFYLRAILPILPSNL
ncbi:hypothetical protein MJH12_05020, partial [bacterium]|nr:hypothetical protein [bacterium]